MAFKAVRHPSFSPYGQDSDLWRAVSKLGFLILALLTVVLVVALLSPR